MPGDVGDETWHEADHPRDDHGRFVAAGTIWYVDQQLSAHQRQHVSEQKATELAAETVRQWKADANEWRGTLSDRDRNFATKTDVSSVETRLRQVETANLLRDQTERDRLIKESDAKADAERRQASDDRDRARQQWVIGLGVLVASIAINLLLRLARF